jgi:mono/diheme cytochrome c family protein
MSRAFFWGVVAGGACLGVIAVGTNVNSQPPATESAPEPAAPSGQTYTGTKQCASCHFKQYMAWKKTKHAKEAWESVPEKYRADPNCVNCHATGYGQPTGFKDAASTPNLVGAGCEACHGPGSEHDKVAKQFKEKKKLSPEEDKAARDSIYKLLPRNVCSDCHASKGHKEHPKYDKE